MATCETCKHFNKETVLCHRYPSRTKTTITHWCGEHKKAGKATAKTTRFVRPTQLELKEYSVSIKFDLDCDDFLNHYDSKGWKIGTGAMKDWKAAVRTWQKKKDKPISSKSCVDCSKDWHSGFKFTGLGKDKKYRCPECSDKRNKETIIKIRKGM
jgi:DNA-directed RNA polymerase subunit RPC12/RpoP